MIKKASTPVILGALNLLIAGNPLLKNQDPHEFTVEKNIEKLNVASLESIESTWLKIPTVCKARGFNASPISLEVKSMNSQLQNIYNSFGV